MRFTTRRTTMALGLLMQTLVPGPFAFAQQPRDAASVGNAVKTAQVVGIVVGRSGRPIRAVRVSLVESVTRASRMDVSDDNGRFQFQSLPAGYYVVSASKVGYVPVSYGEVSPGTGRGATPI